MIQLLRRFPTLLSAFTLAALLATGCGGGAPASTGGSTSGGSGGSSGTGTQAKPTIVGLVTMGQQDFIGNGTLPTNRLLEANAHPGIYSAAVIELTWSQLEPQPNQFDDSALISALQNVQNYNLKYPATPLVAKLRIFAGINTPAWVLQQVGSVTVTDSKTNTQNTLPDFWTPAYSQLWTALQNHLASEYDSNPLIGEVAISVCSSITAEPFVLPGAVNNIQALLAAGYTDAQMETCLSNAPADYGAWKTTPLDYTFNPLFLAATGQSDLNFPIQVIQAFRAALGTRAVVANHDLDNPLPNASLPAIYSEFQTLYANAQAMIPPELSPLEFQTDGPGVDWSMVIPYSISTYHPTEIEIWNTTAVAGGLANITSSQLLQWAAQLKSANATP